MKKIVAIMLTLSFSCVILSGCGASSKGEQDQSLTVYSFSGENEYFSISNGVIVLSSAEDIFYGGDLEANQEKFDDVTAYSMTFYIMSDNRKDVLLSNSAVDTTGETIHISGEIGKCSGDSIIIRESTDKLQNNLYFELETTNLDGENSNYQLQLSLAEITEKTDN